MLVSITGPFASFELFGFRSLTKMLCCLGALWCFARSDGTAETLYGWNVWNVLTGSMSYKFWRTMRSGSSEVSFVDIDRHDLASTCVELLAGKGRVNRKVIRLTHKPRKNPAISEMKTHTTEMMATIPAEYVLPLSKPLNARSNEWSKHGPAPPYNKWSCVNVWLQVRTFYIYRQQKILDWETQFWPTTISGLPGYETH